MPKITHLPEVICYQGEPVHNGVYKRKVFVQGPPMYARFVDGRWYTGEYIAENFTDDQHGLAHQKALAAKDVSPFRHSAVWWGLENPWPFPHDEESK